MSLYPSILCRLENQHTSIRHLLEQTSMERILSAPPGKWNIHEQVAHLACYQPVFTQRIETMLKEETPSFPRYNEDADPAFESWKQMELPTMLHRLDHDRKFLYERLSGLSDNEIARTGIHPRFGRLDICQWTEFFLLHEAHHIFAVFQLALEVRNKA
jgi:hypothetical protein